MTETKCRKYIITELKPKTEAPWTPVFKPEELTSIVFIDNQVIKGAFYVGTCWLWPPLAENDTHGDAHKHYYDEVLAFLGSDAQNPHELYAEMEISLNGEKHIINKSCLIFIPKGMQHGPIRFLKMDRAIFHFTCAPSKQYAGT